MASNTNNQLLKIEQILRENKLLLKEKFKVKDIGIFGSFSRKEQKPTSDLDILVEFDETIGLFDFIRLKYFLTEIIGVKVDLVMKDTLKPRLKDKILKEVLYL